MFCVLVYLFAFSEDMTSLLTFRVWLERKKNAKYDEDDHPQWSELQKLLKPNQIVQTSKVRNKVLVWLSDTLAGQNGPYRSLFASSTKETLPSYPNVDELTIAHDHYLCRRSNKVPADMRPLRMAQIVRVFPNLRSLEMEGCTGLWANVQFPFLNNVTLMGPSSATNHVGSVLQNHTGLIQWLTVGHEFLKNRQELSEDAAEELARIPALELLTHAGPWPIALSAKRRMMSIIIEDVELCRWARDLVDTMHRARYNQLHTLAISLYSQNRGGLDTSYWDDLEMLFLSVAHSLNTLSIKFDFYAGISAYVKLTKLLLPTRVTSLTVTRLYESYKPGFCMGQYLPDLCKFVYVAYSDRTAYPKESPWLTSNSLRRDGWAYMCIAMAFARANQKNELWRCYVPLVPIIGQMAGWTNASGAMSFFTQKQQHFVGTMRALGNF